MVHIEHKEVGSDGKTEMTLEEFKTWLKKFDADKNGRISRDELRAAIRAQGGWFTTWKANRGVKLADTNQNGSIDEKEIKNLIEFAKNHLQLKIIT